jgi:sugar phosphate isomerase/epimerase
MIDAGRDPVGIDSLEPMVTMGFDYIELSLAHMALSSETTFGDLVGRVARSGLRCEACNNFFPPHVRLTGPNADLAAALRYASLAMGRAAQLGVEVIVLGSSGAKNVPEGFPLSKARAQFVELLRQLAPVADRHETTIVIEPISRPEANFINSTGEGLALVREVDHPRIRLLVDYYHMAGESESPTLLHEAGDVIRHVHFARPPNRVFPTTWEQRFDPFFEALGDIQYSRRLSIEAFTGDFEGDGPKTLGLLRQAISRFVRSG